MLALIGTMWAGKRSLGHGLLALLAVGYSYGILRANLPTAASHFLFDASLLGFYASQDWSTKPSEAQRTGRIQMWTLVLIGWPCLLCFVPFQNVLVTLVGLRGNVLLLPLLLFGSRLRTKDLLFLAHGIAILNFVALAVALLEYFLGIERFFPRSEVTNIIYLSRDVAGGDYRIPSLFSSAHAYAGAMVVTIPLLFGAWVQRDWKSTRRQILVLGIMAALLGVLLAATRVHFLVAATLALIATMTSNLSTPKRVAWITALTIVASITVGNERLQRFTTLSDSKMVGERVNGSVNSTFWDILHDYPLGNGLGGGGTSMPYFLQNQVKNQVAMENEYARILAEQGIIGLSLWIAFILSHLLGSSAFQRSPWRTGRMLAWFACTLYLGTGLIGVGLLTSIPLTAFLLLFLGWISTPPFIENVRIFRGSTEAKREALTSMFSV